jgi:predicted transcriptional regulator
LRRHRPVNRGTRSMKFSSLPQSAASVLALLHSAGILLRSEIVQALYNTDGTATSTTDTGIKRLVVDGLIERRTDKSYWLTDKGKEMMQDYAEKKAAHESAVIAPRTVTLRIEHEPVAPATAIAVLAEQATADGEALEERFLAARAMEEVELDAAVDAAVHRLNMPVITSTAARTYRRLVAALDVTIQDALKPITRIVEAQP